MAKHSNFGISALLHGLDGAEFFLGSTPHFQVWERGEEWGHVAEDYATRFNPETQTHDRLPEVPKRRAEFEAWKMDREMYAAQDAAAREFWAYPDQEWQESFQEAWKRNHGMTP